MGRVMVLLGLCLMVVGELRALFDLLTAGMRTSGITRRVCAWRVIATRLSITKCGASTISLTSPCIESKLAGQRLSAAERGNSTDWRLRNLTKWSLRRAVSVPSVVNLQANWGWAWTMIMLPGVYEPCSVVGATWHWGH